MLINKSHHVAYRCIDAKQTVEWHQKHLDMKFVHDTSNFDDSMD
ncbi:Glyoxalase family protein [Cupriavidus basilensis]|uniref:Glyoxalase family protein n=1 Tax=Cupriavidus basilensis TaxID=68895 RepID=A0A0C4YBU0_9BURK|nr:Glyoxalase family protein [Cupriavidus basilensis]